MKRLLLAATVLALMGSAHAAQVTRLPDAMLGSWCPAPEPSGRDALTIYERATSEKAKGDPNCIKVSPSGTHSVEDGCKFGRITTRTHGEDYIVYMRCWSAGDEHRQPLSAAIFAIDDGKLKMWSISPR